MLYVSSATCRLVSQRRVDLFFFVTVRRPYLAFFSQLTAGTQKYIWAEAGKLDPLIVDVVLDELIRAATDGGAGSSRCETIGLLLASMTSISVRGKLIFKLRKVRRFCGYRAALIRLLVSDKNDRREAPADAARLPELGRDLDARAARPYRGVPVAAAESQHALRARDPAPRHTDGERRTAAGAQVRLRVGHQPVAVNIHRPLGGRACIGYAAAARGPGDA
jgi:hypothetical protein